MISGPETAVAACLSAPDRLGAVPASVPGWRTGGDEGENWQFVVARERARSRSLTYASIFVV